MAVLLLLQLLFGNFVQKWYLPQGIDWGVGRLLIADADRDSCYELVFSTYGGPFTVYFYELHLPDTWEVDSVPDLNAPILWDNGDFDNDGLYDLAMQCGSTNPFWVGIAVLESPDSFSCPTQEVWRDTAGPPLVLPISAYDIDQDGKSEIVKDIVSPSYYLGLYEAIEDNHYELIYTDNPDTSQYDAPSSTHAFGDFDGDSKIEFVMGGTGSSSTGAPYWVYECTTNNNYEKVYEEYVPTLNVKDCFAVPDADGDGKLEFVVKGYVIPTGEIHAFIFEATGDNTYEIIKTFTLPGGDYYGGYSDVGDVDGDGIPEIAMEGRQTVYIIKAAGNDSFYVWQTLPGNSSGSSVRVYDVDGNGLSEVIISGNNQTRIYEYQVGIEEDHEPPSLLNACEVHPNPFTNKVDIRFHAQLTGEISVDIYDVSGRLTKSIYGGSADGCNTLTWYGDDNKGRGVPRGIYFIRIKQPDLQQTFCRKVIKMR